MEVDNLNKSTAEELKHHVLPSEEFEEYLMIYDRYRKAVEKINSAEQDVLNAVSMKNKVYQLADEVDRESARRDNFKKVYEQDFVRRDTESEAIRRIQLLSEYKGQFTDYLEYKNEKNKISTRFEREKEAYLKKRREELEPEKKKYEDELSELKKDSLFYAKRKEEEICEGCSSLVEAKKKEIIDYLTCNKTIKNSDLSQKIRNILETESVDRLMCGASEQRLIDMVIGLNGTDQCKRKNTVSRSAVIERNVHGSAIPFAVGMRILLLLFFVFGVSPLQKIAPSGTSVAVVTRNVLQFLLNCLLALLGGGAIFAILYGILEHFELDILGWIVGISGGLFAGWDIFSKHHPTISASSMMGFGNVTHSIITWILQILICLLFVTAVMALVLFTPLIHIFYKPLTDEVVTGLETFAAYFYDHKELFLCLFHMDEAIAYACENRLVAALGRVEDSLENMKYDSGYAKLSKNEKAELDALDDLRRSELEKENKSRRDNQTEAERIRRELEEKETDRLNGLNRKVSAYDEEIKKTNGRIYDIMRKECGKFNEEQMRKPREAADKFVAECVNRKNNLMHQSENDWKYLREKTGKYMDERKWDSRVDSASSVLGAGANISDCLFLTRRQTDENGMAVVRKVSLECKPIIGVYDNKGLEGDNLSEELCHFIEWLSVSIKRMNARSLLDVMKVVDLVSGNSKLKNQEFSRFLRVLDRQEMVKNLVQDLYLKERTMAERSRSIIEQANDKKISLNDLGDMESISGLNRGIMRIDEEEILENPEKPVEGEEGLWEKPIKYNIIIFILPQMGTKSITKNILSEELKKCFTSCERNGIIPIFLVDTANWNAEDKNEDVSWLHHLREKIVWQIFEVGKNKRNLLDIQEIKE